MEASRRVRSLNRLLSARPPSQSEAAKVLRSHGFRDPAQILAALPRLHSNQQQRRSLRRLWPRLVRACAASADPDRALLQFERLATALPHPNMLYHYLLDAPERLDLLVKIFVHSQSLSDTLARNAEYFHFLIGPQTLRAPRSKQQMRAELGRLLLASRRAADRYDIIRKFRRRETLRIGARDLIGSATLEQTTQELSDLADVCLEAVFEIALRKTADQFRLDPHSVGQFALIGMGKLGGQELNYSSDVDVMFVYDEDGALSPGLSRRDFYTKLAEEIVRGVGRQTEEGAIFRLDLRLRPEGASGPLAWSLPECETYYAERGETWERMALLKARCVAGDPEVGRRFLELIEPFVYRRHAGENVLQQMAAIKSRIEREILHSGELTRHVKLGIGGIREIEFILQSLQLLRGGQVPWLRERNSLRALPLLKKAGMLTDQEQRTLSEAYRFLRTVEHRLQMEMDLQTHTIPDEERALARLARSLGFPTVERFQALHEKHTTGVRQIYESLLAEAEREPHTSLAQLSDEHLTRLLTEAGFSDVPGAVRRINSLLHGTGIMHISQRTKELFAGVFGHVMECCRRLANPDAALLHLEKFVLAYGSRALLYEVFVRHPKLVELLLRLGDASRYFSETLQREPGLFDELCRGGELDQPKRMEQMWEELLAAERQSPNAPPMDVARQWKRAELLRIGIEDVMGGVDIEHLHYEISALAETALRFALDQARQHLGLIELPFAVIGLGKFGGQELGYGADLDVLFVGEHQTEAIRLATKLIEFMSLPTEAGRLFALDARLRPDGEKGMLASDLETHRDYYLHRAQLWEKLALTRARYVAGTEMLGRRFVEMIHGILYAAPIGESDLADIRRMRQRIETERVDPSRPEFDFKTGAGGQMDVEFLVQSLQLRYGPAHPEVRTPQTLTALNRLTALGLVEETDSAVLRRHYLFLRRIESVLRRAENTDVARLPHEPRELQWLAVHLGFRTAADFLDAYRDATRAVRQIYNRLMQSPT